MAGNKQLEDHSGEVEKPDGVLTHLSLFSGIGGIDLAAEWAGFKTIGFVEKDVFCQKVLAKHWPGVPIHGDIYQFSKEAVQGTLPQLISAGFPCQPFSDAGPRKGSSDERFLWGEVVRLLKEMEPEWFLGENVAGLLTIDAGLTFGRIIRDLDEAGYCVGWSVIGACDVAAPHERDRVFIIAHSKSKRWIGASPFKTQEPKESPRAPHDDWRDIRFAFTGSCEALVGWGFERPSWFLRDFDGIPDGLDRFRSLGNAVNPYQVYPFLAEIAKAIQGD